MRAHLYLRASTDRQDASRAEALLNTFAAEKGLEVVGQYTENASGTKLDRPELTRMLGNTQEGDVVVVESVDRLSRLSQQDWTKLKRKIEDKGLRLVVVDLPTSQEVISDSITGGILRVINSMLIDLMATMARLDQEKRVERIQQGLAAKRKADPEWKPSGRKVDGALHSKVKGYLSKGSYTKDEIAKLCGCGVATVYRIAKT
ncbi:recombinase family protein [Pseudomonas oryzihabitans]|uniref:recombinase family protein n=1 Tax=Pseudomonas oryzihabitans TaxID=47885 RepID=UPI0021DA4F48|nr:recombinase family protein [Pseudomonas oryzihabitans]